MVLSKKLSRIVDPQASDCLRGDLKLSKKDIAELSKLLIGSKASGTGIDRKRVVNALSQVAGDEPSIEVLSRVLRSTDEMEATRLSAAAALGRLTAGAGESTLVKALPRSEGKVQREIVKSLGKVGGKAALKALDKVVGDENSSLSNP